MHDALIDLVVGSLDIVLFILKDVGHTSLVLGGTAQSGILFFSNYFELY